MFSAITKAKLIFKKKELIIKNGLNPGNRGAKINCNSELVDMAPDLLEG